MLQKKKQREITMRSSSSSFPSTSGAKKTQKGQKRRRGDERDSSSWSVIVNNDDICFAHILPRLNATDVKFVYEVNGETRKLIARSSRAKDLKEKFKIEEMSSISTLEVAWEHKSSWRGRLYDEAAFCWQVAHTNKLELLKWIREEKKCEWDSWTINAAARQGNLEMVKYCVANECPIDRLHAFACEYAAENGHLEVLKYLREEVEAPWDSRTATFAAKYGHLHILEYLVERKYDQFNTSACINTAKNGHLDCLKYLHGTAKVPLNDFAVRGAHERYQTECLQYLLDNNCPLPDGWRYEHGTLQHLRSKTYIHTERVKQRERYKTRVIRATRLKIYSKVLPPSLLFFSTKIWANFACARYIRTHAGRIAAYKSPNC